jgi:threonine/homoserine/homoserine lactone efflux protein
VAESFVGNTEYFTALVLIAGVWTITVLSPGPNLLATLHVTARSGLRQGLAVASGIALGTTLWACASLAGLAVLFEQAAWAYTAAKLAGATYLIIAGSILLLGGSRRTTSATPVSAPPRKLRYAFMFGLVTDVSNPKAAAFFASLFAVSVPAGAPLSFQMGICGLVVAIAFTWYAIAAVLISRPAIAAGYARARRGIERITGGLFVAAGLRLAFARD